MINWFNIPPQNTKTLIQTNSKTQNSKTEIQVSIQISVDKTNKYFSQRRK